MIFLSTCLKFNDNSLSSFKRLIFLLISKIKYFLKYKFCTLQTLYQYFEYISTATFWYFIIAGSQYSKWNDLVSLFCSEKAHSIALACDKSLTFCYGGQTIIFLY